MYTLRVLLNNEQVHTLLEELEKLHDDVKQRIVQSDYEGKAARAHVALQQIVLPLREHVADLIEADRVERQQRKQRYGRGDQVEMFKRRVS